MRYHAVPGLTLYINYTGFLEEYNELEKAEAVGVEGLHHGLECCRGDIAGEILANMSLIYGKQGLPAEEEKTTVTRHKVKSAAINFYMIQLPLKYNIKYTLQHHNNEV